MEYILVLNQNVQKSKCWKWHLFCNCLIWWWWWFWALSITDRTTIPVYVKAETIWTLGSRVTLWRRNVIFIKIRECHFYNCLSQSYGEVFEFMRRTDEKTCLLSRSRPFDAIFGFEYICFFSSCRMSQGRKILYLFSFIRPVLDDSVACTDVYRSNDGSGNGIMTMTERHKWSLPLPLDSPWPTTRDSSVCQMSKEWDK